ncbi:hypothetical protein CRUP_002954 [Coryphaenoides rupestris]|nr:hypothetical protein CRUP_002954 [Coryphaenoides rupestris]
MVVVLNVDLGLLIGVVVSMMTCIEVPGVKILTYHGPIFYGNRSFFREEVSRLLGLTPERIHSLEKTQKALEKRRRDTTVTTVERDASFSSDQEFLKPESVLKILTSSGLMNYVNPQHIFVTVHDAVVYIQNLEVLLNRLT